MPPHPALDFVIRHRFYGLRYRTHFLGFVVLARVLSVALVRSCSSSRLPLCGMFESSARMKKTTTARKREAVSPAPVETFLTMRSPAELRREREALERIAKTSALCCGVLSEMIALRKCYAPTKDGISGPPSDAQIKRFNATVEELAQLIRTQKKPHLLWDCYEAVDRKYPELKLLAEIRRLFERARKNVPPRPLEFFHDLHLSKDVMQQSAGELIEIAGKWLNRSRNPFDESKEKWSRFARILYRYRNRNGASRPEVHLETKAKKHSPDADATGYTVFLEVMHEDQSWTRIYWVNLLRLLRWAGNELLNESLAQLIKPFFFPLDPTEGIATDYKRRKEDRRKAMQNDRARRHRTKKKSRDGVTPPGR